MFFLLRGGVVAGVCFTAVAVFSEGVSGAEAPQIIWASEPVRPDETLVLAGEGFTSDSVVELSEKGDASGKWKALTPVAVTREALKVVLPKKGSQKIWACRVRNGDRVSPVEWLNEPTAWWWLGDAGQSVTPGGWLRIFGLSMDMKGENVLTLTPHSGKPVSLKPKEVTAYALAFEIPKDLPCGDYQASLGTYDTRAVGCGRLGPVTVRSPAAWKQDVFNVKELDKNPHVALQKALLAAQTNGGGIVYFPRGRYSITNTINLPPNTVLRGESMALTSLYWPDYENPPNNLVDGKDFGLENLSLYCQHHKNVIHVSHASQRFFARQVRIRANCYFMIEDARKEFRGRRGPPSHTECGAALSVEGKNFEITACDVYASGYALYTRNAKDGLVAGNTIRYGHRGYRIESAERLIFENNLVEGNDLLAIGNDIATFWGNACCHIYYYKNRIRQMYGADREMMTLDAGGGAYKGVLSAVSGPHLTLASDPTYKDYAPRPHTDWKGSMVQILKGKGAGQYRRVVANSGREWEVDRPWTIVPDTASLISITPFRGQNLFIGNTFEDGGAVQLYGAAHESVVAENTGSRMDGFLVWSLDPHDWCPQPSWYCQFLDNQILEGNGYGHRMSGFGTISAQGVQTSGTIFRRNAIQNNGNMHIGKDSKNTLVEHTVIRQSDKDVSVLCEQAEVYLRDNAFHAAP